MKKLAEGEEGSDETVGTEHGQNRVPVEIAQ